jgi:hypothetical protein
MAGTDFKVGSFKVYRATEGISLGFIDPKSGGYTADKDEVIETDGITVILSDGRKFDNVPQFRGAIDSQWFVPVANKKAKYQPKAADIQVRGTEQRGRERPEKRRVITHRAEEDAVLSIEDRRRQREAANADVRTNPKLETKEAQTVIAAQGQRVPTGDVDVDEFLAVMDAAMDLVMAQYTDQEEVVEVETAPSAAADASLFDLIDSLDEEPNTAPKAPTRFTMPVQREEDVAENTGKVVGRVEKQEELEINVAPARPAVQADAPKPAPRPGNAGAIVVDDQKYVGRINLSGDNQAARPVGDTAAVSSSTSDMVRMADDAQVGRNRAAAGPKPPRVTDGAVGRITRTSTRNESIDVTKISQNAISNIEKGSTLKVAYNIEKGDDAQAGRPIATGDVQEVKTGDSLEEVLPDAATGPTPKSPHAYSTSELDLKYEAIKAVMPEFEWNREKPVSERVQAALKHIRNRQIINAILSVETPVAKEEIKAAIAKELEKAKEPVKKAGKKKKAEEAEEAEEVSSEA